MLPRACCTYVDSPKKVRALTKAVLETCGVVGTENEQ
jgi:hypothetical protein